MANWTQRIEILLALKDDLFKEGVDASLAQLEVLRSAITDMTTPLIELGEESVMLAQNFETSMAKVGTLVGSTSEESIKLLKNYHDELLKMSTQVPESATNLADGMYQAISAGIKTGEALEFVELASKAAVGGMSDTFTAVDAGTSILNAYNLSGEDSARVFDLMFQAVKDGKIEFGQLSSQIGMVAPTAAAAGVKLEEMMGAIATATTKLRPEQAITGLSAAISELNTPASKAEKALKKLGFSSLEAALKQNSLQEIMIKLVKSGESMDAVFGREASRAVNAVGGSAENARKTLDNMNKSVGATDEAFQTMMKTGENIDKMLENVKDAYKISVGESVLPALNLWKKAQIELFESLNKMPEYTKMIAGIAVSVGSVAGQLTNGVASMAKNVVALSEGLGVAQKFGKNFTGTLGKISKAAKAANISLGTIGVTIGALLIAFVAVNAWIDKIEERAEQMDKVTAMSSSEYNKKRLEYIKQLKAEMTQAEVFEMQKDRDAADRAKQRFDSLLKQYKKEFALEGEALEEKLKEQKTTNEKRLMLDEELREYEKRVRLNEEAELKKQQAQQAEEADSNRKLEDEKTRKAREKALESALKDQNKMKESVLKTQREQYLESIKNTDQYYVEMQRLNAEDWEREKAEYVKKAKELRMKKTDLEEGLYLIDRQYIAKSDKINIDEAKKEIETEKKIVDSKEELRKSEIELKKLRATGNAEELKQIELDELAHAEKLALQSITNEEQRLAITQTFANKRQAIIESEKEKTVQYLETLRSIVNDFSVTLGQSFAGADVSFKAFLKKMLTTMLDYIDQMFLATKLTSALKAISTGGLSALTDVAPLVAAKAGIEALKAGIASFDVGGIPQSSGLGMLHKGDVVVNPTSNNAMMNTLAETLADKINGRGMSVNLNVDGRKMAEVTVPHINNMNETLPYGRDVFDSGRYR